MAATKYDLIEWFKIGVEDGRKRMIVWCDTFDYEDYPEYTDKTGDELHKHITYNAGKDMKSLMEVYDLTADMWAQMQEKRAFHY